MATGDVLILTCNQSALPRQCSESVQLRTYECIRVITEDLWRQRTP